MTKKPIYKISQDTKQVSRKSWGIRSAWVVEPSDSFNALIVAYENSFTIGGIADRIASGASKWFAEFTIDAGQDSKEITSLKTFLDTIDLNTLFAELFVTWNSFFEVVTSPVDAKKIELEHFLIETIRITEETTAEEKEVWPRKYVQKDWANEATFWYKDVIHFKVPNLRDKYYGKSKFYKTIDQVVLLWAIDKFYTKLLEKWNIRTKLLIDKSWKLTLQQKEAIKAVINDSMKWLDWWFSTAIVPTDMDTLDLQDDTSTDAFLEYRRDLIRSICIGCSFPYDLLNSEWSNRATIETAKEDMNENLVWPMQAIVLKQLKKHLKLLEIRPENIIDMIMFKPIDISNEKEQMEIITWYKKSWVIDANEARELSPYNLDEREDWNKLTETKDFEQNKNVEDIQKTIKKRYSPNFISKSKNVQ